MQTLQEISDTYDKKKKAIGMRRQASDWEKIFLHKRQLIKDYYPKCAMTFENSTMRKQMT